MVVLTYTGNTNCSLLKNLIRLHFNTFSDISGSTISIPNNPFTNGLRLVYSTNSGSENTNLVDGNTYYVVNSVGNSFRTS